MSGVTINTFDYNVGTYDNVKNNLLADRMAKNRWGKKFSRLYRKNMNDPDNPLISFYIFTAGMRASVGTVENYSNDLLELQAFKGDIENALSVKNSIGAWDIQEAAKSSYFCLLLEKTDSVDIIDDFSGLTLEDTYVLKGIKMSLSASEASVDGRKISWFHEVLYGGNTTTSIHLEPIEDSSVDTYGVHLYGDDGVEYGHYGAEELRGGTTFESVLETYGQEDQAHADFHADQTERITGIWSNLESHLKEVVEMGEVVNTSALEDGEQICVIVGLGQLLDDIDDTIDSIESGLDALENEEGRVSDDLNLIDHLGLHDTLSSEISKPHKVKYIWFLMGKELVRPPTIMDTADPTGETWIIDPEYAWWEEEQFDDIRSKVKDFQQYCEVSSVSSALYASQYTVRVKKDIFELSGWKIYYFVSTFLDVDVKVKKGSFFQRLLSFVLMIVSIVLTAISNNPVWMKILVITSTVLSYAGVLSPEISLLVAAISFGYGIYSTDFSSLAGMDMFKWAVNNVSMVYKMVGIYESIELKNEIKKEAQARAQNVNMHELQDQAMRYIYSESYNQYDELYNMLYHFSPPSVSPPE